MGEHFTTVVPGRQFLFSYPFLKVQEGWNKIRETLNPLGEHQNWKFCIRTISMVSVDQSARNVNCSCVDFTETAVSVSPGSRDRSTTPAPVRWPCSQSSTSRKAYFHVTSDLSRVLTLIQPAGRPLPLLQLLRERWPAHILFTVRITVLISCSWLQTTILRTVQSLERIL